MLDARHQIRTTLTLDDDVLTAARGLAITKEALGSAQNAHHHQTPTKRNGLPLLAIQPKGAPVDLALVNSLRDD